MSLTASQQTRRDYLKQLVKLRIDEYMETSDAEGTVDLNLGDVEYELSRAPRYVLSVVDRVVGLTSAKSTNAITLVDDAANAKSIIPLPSDYLRFISLEMDDWKRPANELLSDTSRAYRDQQFSMRRGTNEQPKAFIIPYVIGETGTVPTGFVLVEQDSLVSLTPDVGQEFTNLDPDTFVITDLEGPISNHYWAYVTAGTPAVGENFTVVLSPGNVLSVHVRYTEGQSYNEDVSNKAIEAYPNSTLTKLTYIPYLQDYEMPDELEDALVWYAASRVFGIVERYDGVKFAMEQFTQAVTFLRQGMKGDG